jgi:hypothetical protein
MKLEKRSAAPSWGTYPICDAAGIMFAFEINNMQRARSLATLLRGLDGVTDVRPRTRWTGSPDVHIRFRYREREHIVWEPWGDSSRWWIGPEDTEAPHRSIADLEQAIANAAPGLISKFFGV